MNKFFKILFFIFLINFKALSQSNFSLKLSGFNYCFTKYSIQNNFQNGLNQKQSLIIEPGFIISYDNFITGDYFSFRLKQGLFIDKLNMKSGFTSLGLRRKLFSNFEHSLNFAIGPSIIYRDSWNKISGYNNEDDYNVNGYIEYKFMIINAEIEYNYSISPKSDISLSINYNQPYTIGFSAGLRYWFNKKVRNKKKCISCPSFH
ncbi:MAG: hypothetical protein A2046_05570 [Bacteroidetes bacterium GWA2_30_7]|nr:MAG: hypothetical protein A2046_05570 [Bacteroidetes bacterium GWA2_30_7]